MHRPTLSAPSSWRAPRLLSHISSLIPDRSRSHLVPYNVTSLERDVSLALGIPLYGADPRFFDLGTKSGCRALFAEEGVTGTRQVSRVSTPSTTSSAR